MSFLNFFHRRKSPSPNQNQGGRRLGGGGDQPWYNPSFGGGGGGSDSDSDDDVRAIPPPRPLMRAFRTFSAAFYHNDVVKASLDRTDKGIFPETILNDLKTRNGRMLITSSNGFDDPVTFRVTNRKNGKVAYCSVMQFEPVQSGSGIEGSDSVAYLPAWIMRNLGAGDDCPLLYEQVFLPLGTSVVLQPLDKMFYERTKTTDPSALLESMLSSNCVLWESECIDCYDSTTGDYIPFRITKLEPSNAVSIINATLKTDFEAMPGLEEYEKEERKKAAEAAASQQKPSEQSAAATTTTTTTTTTTGAVTQTESEERMLEYEEEDGEMEDGEEDDQEEETAAFVPFGGQGHCLGGSESVVTVKPAEPAKIEGGVMTTASELEDVKDCSLCPNCGKYISNVSFNIHKMRCARFNVRCPVCNESVPRTSLEAHNKEKHVPIPCDQCGACFLPGDMERHKANDCPEGMVPCKYCQLNVLRKKLREHEGLCGAKSTKCPICGASVPKNMLSDHISLGCSNPRRQQSPERGGGTRQDPFMIDDEPSISKDESGSLCPKCHRAFSYVDIVEHVQHCDGGVSAPPQKRPIPDVDPDQRRRRPTEESGVICPKCHRSFTFEEIVDHAEHCNGNDSSSVREEEKVMCPKCNRRFTVVEIVDHVDRCGKTQTPSSSQRREEVFICPYCNRDNFDSEMEFMNHMSSCVDSSSSSGRRSESRPTQSRNSDGLSTCPFCGVFRSDIPAAMEMHMADCANKRFG